MALLLLSLVACPEADPSDQDGDGVAAALDCDDTDAAVGLPPLAAYLDADGDGAGDDASAELVCALSAGLVATGGDCNDDDDAIGPTEPEHCDGVDEDCDGSVDDHAIDAVPWYPDVDGDGFGTDLGEVEASCAAVAEASLEAGDCDDGDELVFPGSVELCNGVDDDCNGEVDDDPVDSPTWYADADQDGFGDDAASTVSCPPPPGTAAVGGDCDDEDPTRSPGAAEACGDELDQDCDGEAPRCVWSGVHNASVEGINLRGSAAGGQLGSAVVNLGDVDGDGLDDLAASAAQAETSAGKVWLVPGAGLGASGGIAAVSTGMADGEDAGNGAGFSLAALDDITGDGVRDLLIGAQHGGVAWIVSADLVGPLGLESAPVRLVGEATSGFGTALAAAGDVDGDGWPEVLLSAPHAGTAAGAVYLFPGPIAEGEITPDDAGSTWTGERDDDAGTTLAGGHDLDGDGLSDLAVGSTTGPGGMGAIWTVGQPAAGTSALTDAAALLTGADPTDGMGAALASLGDATGDGYGDLLVGASTDAEGGAEAGAVYLLAGPPTSGSIPALAPTKIVGTADLALGKVLVGPGDLDQDGVADFLLGAPEAAAQAGVVYLFYGPGTAGTVAVTSANAEFNGGEGASGTGTAIAAADLDGDGLADLQLTAPLWSGDGLGLAGIVYLLDGPE